MTKRIMILSSLVLAIYVSWAAAQEEVRLSTILPVSGTLRGFRGGVGAHYGNVNDLPDGSIESGHLYVEGGVDVGSMYDSTDPHRAYINSVTGGGVLRIGNWGDGYADGTMSGVVAGIALGNGNIHSFEHLYLAIGQNMRWTATDIIRMSEGPGTFMLLGQTWGAADKPGLFFKIVPVGPAGESIGAKGCLVLEITSNKPHLWTFANGSTNPGSGGHFKVNGGDVGPLSDINLKKDIATITNALNYIDTMRGVTFKWKDEDDSYLHSGVIAQEVEKKFPELVYANPAGIKYVSYEGIDGVLIEAVKELKKKRDELRLRNNSLKTASEKLKKQNRLFEERISRLEKGQ